MAVLARFGFAAEPSNAKQETKKTMSMEEFVTQYNKGVTGDKKLFDDFFSENYFSTNPEPFRQVDNIRGLMREMIKNVQLDFFEHSFNEWYNARMGVEDLGITTEDKKDKTIIKVQIPGLDAGNVDVNINDKRIKLNGSYSTVNEVKDSKNVVTKTQEYKSFSKILPVPANVDAGKAQIKIEKDVITIILSKKP
jgi:HSP20 family molecular chaperone IbpA